MRQWCSHRSGRTHRCANVPPMPLLTYRTYSSVSNLNDQKNIKQWLGPATLAPPSTISAPVPTALLSCAASVNRATGAVTMVPACTAAPVHTLLATPRSVRRSHRAATTPPGDTAVDDQRSHGGTAALLGCGDVGRIAPQCTLDAHTARHAQRSGRRAGGGVRPVHDCVRTLDVLADRRPALNQQGTRKRTGRRPRRVGVRVAVHGARNVRHRSHVQRFRHTGTAAHHQGARVGGGCGAVRIPLAPPRAVASVSSFRVA